MNIDVTSVLVDDQDRALRCTRTDMGTVTTAVFDDTCGNLVQIHSQP